MRWIRVFIPVTLALCAAYGQGQPAGPAFEVSSVKPSAPANGPQVNIGLRIDGAQVHIARLSLKDYLRMAYRVKLYQVTGPEWLATEKFDIDAKLPEGATRDQVPEMLQALLVDRFQIKAHRESKELPVYALTVASGGLKMKESPADAEGDAADPAKDSVAVNASGGPGGVGVNFGKGSSFDFSNNRLEGKKLTMTSLVDTLARFVDRPVIDLTKIPGKYDFVIELTPEDYRSMLMRSAVSAGVSLPPQALQFLNNATDGSLFAGIAKLGLKLDSRKAPLEVLVIDNASKTPADN